jgi:type IV pilus assembly protein PilM
LNVRALDIASMALKRLVAWSDKGEGRDGQNALLIDIGPAATELMVISGRRLMLERAVEFGEQRLVARVARLLELQEPTARRLLSDHVGQASAPSELDGALREILGTEFMVLKTEVGKTLDYAASKTRGNGVETIFLVGAAARFPGIAQLLSSAFAKPVRLLDPLAMFAHRLSAEQVAALSCGAAVAIGLAVRGVEKP